MAKFQSTPPARGATARTPAGSPRRLDFNPRPPRGGRPFCSISLTLSAHFNPRPPRGGRQPLLLKPKPPILFQSTPPARGATGCSSAAWRARTYFNPRPPRGGRHTTRAYCYPLTSYFNPRPPRGGRPFSRSPSKCRYRDFNPRPPRGGRPVKSLQTAIYDPFQSTPPARGATATDFILSRL